MNDEIGITASSGNVFADLGFEEPEEELAKAQLTSRIGTIIDQRGWSEGHAATVLDMNQAELSGLLLGDFGDVSTERLLRLLTVLDQNIEIIVTPRESSQARAAIVVHVESEPVVTGRR